MKYVKLDVSKSHIDLIFINTLACQYCKWSLLSLLENFRWAKAIIATTSLELDPWQVGAEKVCFSCWSSPYTSKKNGYNLFYPIGTNMGLIWEPCDLELWRMSLTWVLRCRRMDNYLPSTHHSLLPGRQDTGGYGISCTSSTPSLVSLSFLLD